MNNVIPFALKSLVFAVSVCCLYSPAASAFPFEETPDSFATYLNGIEWNDGKSRVFSGLLGCRRSYINPSRWYGCRHGYVEIEDRVRGNILCEIQIFDYGMSVEYNKGKVKHGQAYPCREL